MALVVNTK